MKLSIIIPVLNSHEVVRRQLLHMARLARLNLRDELEVIIVDDGSDPPLQIQERTCFDYGYNGATDSAGGCPIEKYDSHPFDLTLIRTNDPRPWTWALARNVGARHARGQYLMMFDVDHFISQDALDFARAFNGDKIQFKREFGVLNEDGKIDQGHDTLKAHGLSDRWNTDDLTFPPLPNNFVMRADIFWELGGYVEDRIGKRYPQGEDSAFKWQWSQRVKSGQYVVSTYRPNIYMFPNGQYCENDVDFNPFGLFHSLSRKNNANPLHRRLKREED